MRWRCFLWLPSEARELWTSLVLFVLLIIAMPYEVKIALSARDLAVPNIDYRPIAAFGLILLLLAVNLLVIYKVASGDYFSEQRLWLVTVLTWATLSAVTVALALAFELAPSYSLLEPPNFLSKIIRYAVGSQLVLALALTKGAFKGGTAASALRKSWAMARRLLRGLRKRRKKTDHDEVGDDSGDWDQLELQLEALIRGGQALQQDLICQEERESAAQIVAKAKAMQATIKESPEPFRNKQLYSAAVTPFVQ